MVAEEKKKKKKMKKVLIVIGTRPNCIKVTQFKRIVENKYPDIDLKIVHTGQHYDHKMADVFFEQFKLQPDYFLNIEPSSPVSQMASIMVKLEEKDLIVFTRQVRHCIPTVDVHIWNPRKQ